MGYQEMFLHWSAGQTRNRLPNLGSAQKVCVGLGDIVSDEWSGAGFMVGLVNLGGLFQS